MKNKFSIALSLAVVLAMLLTSLALADQVSNTVDTVAEVMPLTVGANGTTNLYVIPDNGDGKNGCNLTGSTLLKVSVSSSNALIATVSPSSLTFSSCGDVQVVTVHAVAAGSVNIIIAQTLNTTAGSFDLAPAQFSVNVSPATPTNTAPTVVVAGVAGGDSYEFGSVPSVTCEVTDLEDGNTSFAATLSAVSGPLATYGLGEQTASCSYSDNGGLTASASVTYGIVDTTAPVIAAHDDVTAEATGSTGALVSYSSPATVDTVFGAGVATCDLASGSWFPLGDTTVLCDATDGAGNEAIQTSFVISVVDTTPPAISGTPSDMTEEATSAAGAVVSYTSPTASDLVDGSVLVNCLPASGSIFALDTTPVTCTAKDVRNNSAQTSFTVIVQDTTAPTVTVPADMTKEATGSAGVTATFSASATDLVDGAVATSCSPASGSTFALGTTLVTCSATDTAGNTGSAGFSVTVQDTTAPALTLPANMTVSATSAFGAVVTYSTSANDIVDGVVAVTCSPASGSLFAPGTTTVNCSAADAAGNTANGSFTISVQFQLNGFYAPVDMNGVWNTVRGGSTVPLKFEVFAGSTELTSTSVVNTFTVTGVACNGATADDIELTTTGGTSLRYDSTAGQFIQNWQTPRSAGSCYRVTMTTHDGSTLSALFKLK